MELEELGLPPVRHDANAQPRSPDDILQIVKAAHPQRQGKETHLKDPGVKSGVVANAQSIFLAEAVAIADTVFAEAELCRVETSGGRGVYIISKRKPREADHRLGSCNLAQDLTLGSTVKNRLAKRNRDNQDIS